MDSGGRRLEVIVLAARGLQDADSRSTGRRKVQLTLLSAQDPEGEAFGAKVCPWTEPRGKSQQVRFGPQGRRCSFLLSDGPGRAVAADVRFQESSELRVRLLTSMVSSRNVAMKAAASFLPTSVVDGVSQELDQLTAELEAEARIPLTNILSGRVGFAADRALGGWVPLKACLRDEGVDLPGPALWMQMHVIPDHQDMVPALRHQLEEEIAKLSNSKRPVAALAPASGAGAMPVQADARRWGPSATGTNVAAANAQGPPVTETVGDLVDVSLDAPDPYADVSGRPNVAAPPQSDVSLLGDLFFNDDTVGAGNLTDTTAESASTGVPGDPGFNLLTLTEALPRVGDGYVDQAPSDRGSSDGGLSAFGFIAGSNAGGGAPKLDLAALYAAPTDAPVPPAYVDSRFTALNGFELPPRGVAAPKAPAGRPSAGGLNGASFNGLSGAPAGGQTGAGASLESLEQNLLAGLSQSLKV